MTVSLGNVTVLRTGVAFRGPGGLPEVSGGDLLVIQGRDVDSTSPLLHLRPDGGTAVRQADVPNWHDEELRWGEILVMARGPRNYAAAVQETPERPLVASASFHVLTPDRSKVDPFFLAWQLNDEGAQNYLRQHNSGTTIPMIRQSVLAGTPIQLPPLHVQKEIASLLILMEDEKRLQLQLDERRRQAIRAAAYSHL